MLKVWVKGFRDDCIKAPGLYFNRVKKKEWFNRSDIKQIIKEIDNTIAVKDEYLESPVYGGMSPEILYVIYMLRGVGIIAFLVY